MNRILAGTGIVLLVVAAIVPFALAVAGPLSGASDLLLALPALAGVAALVLFALAAAQPTRRLGARR